MVWGVTPQDEAGTFPPQLAQQHSHSDALAAQEPGGDVARKEQYQAVLLTGDKLLRTTFHKTDVKSLGQVKIPRLPLGTVWGYYMQVPDTAWLAEPEEVEASSAQSWLSQISTDAWYGGPVLRQGCRRLYSAELHERLPHGLPPAHHWASRRNDLPTALCLGQRPMSHRGLVCLGHHLQ